MEYNGKKVHFKRLRGLSSYKTQIRQVYYCNQCIGLVEFRKGKATFYPINERNKYIAEKFTEAVRFYLDKKEAPEN